MTDLLPFAIWALTISAWMSAAVLVRAALIKPRVGALNERATVAVGVAIFGTVYSLVVLNAEVLHVIETSDAVNIVRAAVVVVLLLPVWWTFLYLTHRLGGGG
jgi:hypothetical protein